MSYHQIRFFFIETKYLNLNNSLVLSGYPNIIRFIYPASWFVKGSGSEFLLRRESDLILFISIIVFHFLLKIDIFVVSVKLFSLKVNQFGVLIGKTTLEKHMFTTLRNFSFLYFKVYLAHLSVINSITFLKHNNVVYAKSVSTCFKICFISEQLIYIFYYNYNIKMIIIKNNPIKSVKC